MDKEVEEEKKSKKKKYLLLLLLLLLLLKILFWCNYFKKTTEVFEEQKENNNTVVTNTITQETNNIINNVNTETGSIVNNSAVENVTKPEETQKPEVPEIKEFKVTSNGQKITENLTIFDAVKYNEKAIIYPGISNTYNFEISSTLDFSVLCEAAFEEKNIENLPIKYRLKENGKYIRGNENTYVSYNQLNFSKIVNSQNENKYELEWKWLEGDNDNLYGDVNKNITYELKLTVKAKQQTEE